VRKQLREMRLGRLLVQMPDDDERFVSAPTTYDGGVHDLSKSSKTEQ